MVVPLYPFTTSLAESYARTFMKYRSRTDIAAAILQIAKNGAIKTHIMYKAFMSYPQLTEYLAMLQETDMLEFNQAQKVFVTTKTGEHFLHMYESLEKMLPRDNILKRDLTTSQ